MSENLLIRPYQTDTLYVEVPFTREAFFNATEAAKPFGKQPSDWTRLKETQEYIDAVRGILRTEQNQLVRIVQGGNPQEQGTWLHPKLAIAFARWLNAYFAVWCDQQIEDILRYGFAGDPKVLDRLFFRQQKALQQLERTRWPDARAILCQQIRDLCRVLNHVVPEDLGQYGQQELSLKGKKQ